MKNWSIAVVGLAVIAIASVGVPARGGEDADLARQLRSAGKAFLASSSVRDMDGIRGPLVEILGVASEVAEKAELPKGVATKLREAHALLRDGEKPFPDPQAGRALDEAYAALHGGSRFTFPPGIRTIDQAREACQREIDGAADALEAGRRGEATRGIVDFFMLVTTPMEAR